MKDLRYKHDQISLDNELFLLIKPRKWYVWYLKAVVFVKLVVGFVK